jgi:hypothetical protein
MIQRQEHVDAAAKIRNWSRKDNPNITFGVRYADGETHSLRAMADDDIDFEDLLRVLRSCRVTDLRLEKGEWRHNAEGRNKDGRHLVFVVVLDDVAEEIEVVTAWAVKKR